VPSPAAISLLHTSLVTTPGPLVGPARPTCNYPFPIPTGPLPSNSTTPLVRPPLASLSNTPNSGFVPTTKPILPEPGPTPWTHTFISFNQDPINPDLDTLPTGTFTIHTHPTLHDTTILCTPDGQAVTTLFGPCIRHLFQLFCPDLTHRSFEEEVYRLITRLGSRSEIHSPTPATTTRNRWTIREDLLSALRSTFHIQNGLYSDPLLTNPYTLILTTHSTMKTSSSHPTAVTHQTPGMALTSVIRSTTTNVYDAP
jgi:hypothetical protein